jgi:hypothetical protein
MMTNAFVSALGAKVGRVMDFVLSDALMSHMMMKMRGQGIMEFGEI